MSFHITLVTLLKCCYNLQFVNISSSNFKMLWLMTIQTLCCQILQAIVTFAEVFPLFVNFFVLLTKRLRGTQVFNWTPIKYLFSPKSLHVCILQLQCLKRLPDESMADELMVVSLWKHEMNRIIRDRISRSADLNWFDEILEKTLVQVWCMGWWPYNTFNKLNWWCSFH